MRIKSKKLFLQLQARIAQLAQMKDSTGYNQPGCRPGHNPDRKGLTTPCHGKVNRQRVEPSKIAQRLRDLAKARGTATFGI